MNRDCEPFRDGLGRNLRFKRSGGNRLYSINQENYVSISSI